MESQIKCNDTTEESIQNTSEKPERRVYTLLDLSRLKFKLDGVEQAYDVETATAEQFNAFAQEVANVDNVDISIWPLEERRNLVNELWAFCQAEYMEFPLKDSGEEQCTPTAPLIQEVEESGFLHDVERAKPVIASNPEMSAKELAESLGLKSALYAQTVKVYVNAHKSAEEEHTHAE